MNLDLHRAYKFQTEDPNWVKKVAVITAAYLLEIVIIIVIMLVGLFTSLFLFRSNIAAFVLIMAMLFIADILLLFPISAYVYGYFSEILKTVMAGDKNNLPELNPISQKLKSGFKLLIMQLPQNLILSILAIPYLWSLFSVMYAKGNADISIWLLILLVSGFTFFILSCFISYVVMPAQLFIFTKYGLKEAFNYGKIFNLIKTYSSTLIYYDLVTFLGSAAIGALSNIPVIGILVMPFAMNMVYHLNGQVFAELDKKITLKA